MRYAIWAAVSTEQQAESDKASLPVQEETCKRAADLKGWTDTGLRFIVPGESRTRWMDLSTAASHIPALRQLISCAENNKFDILVLYDFNRLRDLLQPVSMFLGSFGIRLYSTNQPVEPQESDTHIIMEGMAGIISQLQIRDLTRKFQSSMPRRISDRGLPHHIPYGYKKPEGHELDPAAVPIQDIYAAIVIQIKDRFLAGQSLPQIAGWLEQSGIPSPRGRKKWVPYTIWYILHNPFYSGIVSFGTSKYRANKLTGKWHVEKRPVNEIIMGRGKHQPLWGEQTQRQINAEWKRRGKKFTGRRTHVLSGLLFCGLCGKVMWAGSHQDFRCSGRIKHLVIKEDDALQKFGILLAESARHYPPDQPPPSSPDTLDRQALLADLNTRLDRLKEGFLSGIFNKLEYSERSAGYIKQIAEIETEIEMDKDRHQEQQAKLDILDELAGIENRIMDFLTNSDPQEVNRLLHLIIKRVIVLEDKTLRIELL